MKNRNTIYVFFVIGLFFFYNTNAQCTPSGNVNWNNFGITNVSITGDGSSAINNSSGIQQLYVDNTSMSVDVTAGNTYNFSVISQKETWGNLKMRFWIDYDGTGNYVQVYDSGNYVNNNNATQTFTGSFTIDGSAVTSNVVLRIAASYCSNCGGGATMSADGCVFQGRAEIEDYTLNIGGGAASYCTPSNIGGWNTLYISEFDFETINNTTTGSTGGFSDFTSMSPADINPGQTFTGNIEVTLNNWNTNTNVVSVWVDFNGNNSFEDPGERFLFNFQKSSGGHTTVNVPISFFVPNASQIGNTRMRIGVRGGNSTSFTSCNYANSNGEVEDYSVNIGTVVPIQDISLLGDGEAINNGATTTSDVNLTDFGIKDINSGSFPHTFEITNDGSLALNLLLPYVSLSGSADFSIISQPLDTNLLPGESTTFIIEYDPSAIGNASTIVSVLSDDPDENPYTFLLEGEGDMIFADTDGDGVSDIIDIDDDNDGLLDSYEANICTSTPVSKTTDLVFLNETFGSGLNRTEINGTNSGATTTYCYEDGTGSCSGSTNVNDGDYTVHYIITNNNNSTEDIDTDIAVWAEDFWYDGEDHTSGDVNGRMAIFNATADPGVFYSQSIIGATPNVPVQFGFYAINIDREDAPGIGGRIRPEVVITIYDPLGNVITSETSGEIEPTSPAGDWVEVSASFTTGFSEFTVELSNANLGGIGNDLAIDDVFVKQTLCDLDGDGVADILDLDNDNDGIPNVVELGLIDDNNDATVFGDVSNVWVDANFNGMHDAYENITPVDSDDDGTPDFLDLDSDNDGIFDNLEYDGLGDIDVNGNGVGDGSDFQDPFINNLNDEQDGDGILTILDDNDDDNDSSSDHGTFSYSDPIDDDGDGIPNYLDVDSNDASNDPTNGSDISDTLYSDLDTNSDGIIDDTNDSDGDGIVDLFDTDNTLYGSPRDLDRKLTLYFDGRNDYIEEDTNVIEGLSQVTQMAWIKIDNDFNSNSAVMGHANFWIRVNSRRKVRVYMNGGVNLTTDNVINLNEWTHICAVYDATLSNNRLKLYINGELSASGNITSGIIQHHSDNVFRIGRKPWNTGLPFYFNGHIDEARVFNKSLSQNEIHKIIYQEIEQNGSNIRGAEIPRDITDFIDESTINTLPWSNLIRYYRLDNFKGDITDDLTTPTIDTGTGAKLYNIKQIEYQSAPMPFITQTSGSLETAVDIPLEGVNGDDAITYDWSIVRIKHDDVTYNDEQKHLGLFVDEQDASANDIEFTVLNDSELNISWYLQLDGKIDLEGESQLVQGFDSALSVGANGELERDQQGTADLYTYNYWSSPVGSADTAINNYSYTLENIMYDGNQPISFISSGFDGENTNPIKIADYWIWKFANRPSDDYSEWQQVRSTGSINAGEGFTMKGPGSGAITALQNYVFNGKPNNGDVNLTLSANNDYLVGNPYASAIDANTFITDNGPELLYDNSPNPDSTPLISGTLYFWEHWGGGSHILEEYQGGYATYNFSGAVAAASLGTNDPDVATGGMPTVLPGRYIPVGQGFFVVGENSGTINFNNGQRIFQKEDGVNSVFARSNSSNNVDESVNSITEDPDDRMKFRIGFNSVNTLRRQLLLTIDDNTTIDVDWAYDAKMNEDQIDDMYWLINDEAYIIQGSDKAEETAVYPIGIKTSSDGINTITIDALKNVPNDFNVYLHDIELDYYHNLRTSNYEIFLNAGEYKNRFQITFGINNLLGVNDTDINNLNVIYSNDKQNIILVNPTLIDVKSIEVYNLLGQSVLTIKDILNQTHSEYAAKHLTTGAYIIKLNTINGTTSKKVVVR